MSVQYSIRERVALLLSNAHQLVLQLEEQGIEIPVTINYGDGEAYVCRGYGKDNDRTQVRIEYKEPTCNSAQAVASALPGQEY